MSTTYNAPIAHADDPVSSVEAAHEVSESGRRDNHCSIVFAVVKAHPGLTSAEIAHQVRHEMDLTETRRRLYDLKNAGSVVQGDVRHCTLGSRRRMVTWSVPPASREIRNHQAELFG